MTDDGTIGEWAKYAWAIVIAIFILLLGSAVVSFFLLPTLGMGAMFIPLGVGAVALGFVWINRDKFSRV